MIQPCCAANERNRAPRSQDRTRDLLCSVGRGVTGVEGSIRAMGVDDMQCVIIEKQIDVRNDTWSASPHHAAALG